jgi:hypothetical protein
LNIYTDVDKGDCMNSYRNEYHFLYGIIDCFWMHLFKEQIKKLQNKLTMDDYKQLYKLTKSSSSLMHCEEILVYNFYL